LELDVMIPLVQEEYPEATSNQDIAKLVSDIFKVQCSFMDIAGYTECQFIANQDYELESKRQEYGHSY